MSSFPCGFLQNAADAAQAAILWLTDGPKRLFNDIDATGDLLRLTRSVQKITSVFRQIVPLDLIAKGVSSVIEFINSRDTVCQVYSLVSGEAARENPLAPFRPLNVVKTFCSLVQDVTSSLGWLVSIKMLGEWVSTSTARIASWGKPFIVLDGVSDVSFIAGGLFGIADSLRLIAMEAMDGSYWVNGRWSPSRCIDRCLDVAMDVCSVAASVLNNIPGVSVLFVFGSSAIGSLVSLGKFYKKEYWDGAPAAAPAPQGINAV